MAVGVGAGRVAPAATAAAIASNRRRPQPCGSAQPALMSQDGRAPA
jgi:hypothetical protein